ncbi:MAG TPA: hypothetical protein VGI20_05240 [Rhizomicrobium sp.]|jgi:tetratricopeptide (TPR) repeat protein
MRGDPGNRRLNTWKEIAGFFGRDERTVKRWEADRGLPVRRLPRGSRSTVFAYEQDLAAWLDKGGATEDAADPVAPPPTVSGASKNPGLTWNRFLVPVLLAFACGMAVGIVVRPLVKSTGPVAASVRTTERTPSAEAVNFYRAGLYEWQTRTPAGLDRAVDDFTQAIVRDPLYAEAYAGLANAYNLLREFSTMAPEESFPRAKAAAERAIALNPALGEAHAALAFVAFYWSHNAGEARREFERAVALEPRNPTVHHWYANYLLAMNDVGPALAEIDRAEALDSASSAILADKALILFYAGRADDAVALLKRIEQTEPRFYSVHHYLATIYGVHGDNAGYVNELAAAAASRNDTAGAEVAAAAARGLARGGREAMLRDMLETQKRLCSAGKADAYEIAETYAGLGDPANALTYLNRSLSRHEAQIVNIRIDPWFARMQSSKEFASLESQVGFPVRS